MTKDIQHLRNAVGHVVSEVAAEVLFYSVETKGVLGVVTVRFADGNQFTLGCAGKGGVFVTRSRPATGSAPGFITERRTVEVGGELRAVSLSPDGLQLEIGKHQLQLVNHDDELSVTVDGKALPRQIFKR